MKKTTTDKPTPTEPALTDLFEVGKLGPEFFNDHTFAASLNRNQIKTVSRGLLNVFHDVLTHAVRIDAVTCNPSALVNYGILLVPDGKAYSDIFVPPTRTEIEDALTAFPDGTRLEMAIETATAASDCSWIDSLGHDCSPTNADAEQALQAVVSLCPILRDVSPHDYQYAFRAIIKSAPVSPDALAAILSSGKKIMPSVLVELLQPYCKAECGLPADYAELHPGLCSALLDWPACRAHVRMAVAQVLCALPVSDQVTEHIVSHRDNGLCATWIAHGRAARATT